MVFIVKSGAGGGAYNGIQKSNDAVNSVLRIVALDILPVNAFAVPSNGGFYADIVKAVGLRFQHFLYLKVGAKGLLLK